MKKLSAFAHGVREFRSLWTIRYTNLDLLRYYDWGREIAHMVTLRRYE